MLVALIAEISVWPSLAGDAEARGTLEAWLGSARGQTPSAAATEPSPNAFRNLRRSITVSPSAFYGRCGKMPWRAMQKLTARYGMRLLWGRSPPAGAMTSGAMLTRPALVTV